MKAPCADGIFAILNSHVASEVLGASTTYLIKAHNVPHGLSDYKGREPLDALDRMARMLNGLTAVVKQLNFNVKRALDEVNDDYSTTTDLADILQRDANVPFRVGHHFASEPVNYGRGLNLRPADIAYDQAQRIYAEAAKHYKMDSAWLPLSEAQFRKSLTAENMIQSAQVGRRAATGRSRAHADGAARELESRSRLARCDKNEIGGGDETAGCRLRAIENTALTVV